MNYEKLEKEEEDESVEVGCIKDEQCRQLIWKQCSWGLALLICILITCFVIKFIKIIDSIN